MFKPDLLRPQKEAYFALCMAAQMPTACHMDAHTHAGNKAQHITAQHSTAQHSTAQHSTAQHSTAQHSTAQHSTAQHSTAQHSTAHHHAMSTCYHVFPSLSLTTKQHTPLTSPAIICTHSLMCCSSVTACCLLGSLGMQQGSKCFTAHTCG